MINISIFTFILIILLTIISIFFICLLLKFTNLLYKKNCLDILYKKLLSIEELNKELEDLTNKIKNKLKENKNG